MFIFRFFYRLLKLLFFLVLGMLLGQYEFEKKPVGLHLKEYLYSMYEKNKDHPSVDKVRRRIAHAVGKVVPSKEIPTKK